jgi:glycosyltransferase involved in cell wall biosynthesis
MAGTMDKKNIFYVVDTFQGCAWYRCHVPGMELKRAGHDVMLDEGIAPEDVQNSDIVVFQRQWRPEAVRAMADAKARGKLVVYELDDDLWNLHTSNPGYEAWSRPGMLQAVETMVRMADVVTTTTPALANQLKRLNANVKILPNMLPAEHWQVQHERPEGYDRVAIGWAGSSSRWNDLAIVKEVVLQLLKDFPQVDVLVAGDDSNMVFPPHERIHRLSPVQIERYPDLLAKFDIGIAPVVDSRFNQAKSDLKFLEYSMLGVPTVVSRVEAYGRSVKNGENGFLATNAKDWLKYLSRLVAQPGLRREIGCNARAFAARRTIDKNVWRWERAYGIEESVTRGSAGAA